MLARKALAVTASCLTHNVNDGAVMCRLGHLALDYHNEELS
jgi:hypothetical protein